MNATTEQLQSLLDRVEAAAGPDRELDVALLALWDPDHDALKSYDDRYQTEFRDGGFSVWAKDGGYSASTPFPRFTSSVDAALALVERLFGHAAYVSVGVNIGGAMHDASVKLAEDVKAHNSAPCRMPALAILAALLTALVARAAQ